jgi:glycosyltransferase involved in cell wall biosynthesis
VNVDLLVPERDRKTSGAAGDLIPVVGSVGRLTRVKGHHVFLRAARSVLDMGIEAMFAIVGEGEEEKSLRGLVKDLRLQYNVTFSPHIPNRPELYRVFDIVVVPTLRGGMGSTALEAMSMGKPVIASKVGEILHIIQDGKTGLLVPEGDADVLARRISELISHPALSKALGNEARAYVVDNFSLAPMVKSTREFYAEALSMFSGKGLRKEDFSSAGGSR